ncbi:hypothetical protein [Fulvivirga lutimaris]|uniref:hypothetical protein n=1 Tax=Fulvivirga lutimaris TaxID=1819566 RepID=UPI0012BBE84D|nr:hypothetical protein [Fulvivirga lutimaris]MTI40117.1 hypothetical protein [Fulvivirga lutimaris]
MNKLIKAFWFFTLLATLATLLYTYAAIPIGGSLSLFDGQNTISRETVFNVSLAFITICNFSIYSIARKFRKSEVPVAEFLVGWLMSFATVLNFFFMSSLTFIQLVNSGENFDFSNFGYYIYITLGLVIGWVVALPFFILNLKNKA